MKQLILGPQRPKLILGREMRKYELDRGKIVVISAGWQAAEGDIEGIRGEVEQPVDDLQLYQHCEAVFAKDPELHAAYRQRLETLTELQHHYRLRLKQHNIAVRQTLRATGSPDVLVEERHHAMEQLRALDLHHRSQMNAAQARFDREFNVITSPALATHTKAVHEQLAEADTVIITGGNLLVLINRLRLLGLKSLLAGKNIVAWSAGAMMLGDVVVLFHDRMPQGLRDAEVIDEGLALLSNSYVMPDAKNRLRIGNKLRMSAMSRRFEPAVGYQLNSGSMALFEGGKLIDSQAVRYSSGTGIIERVTT